MRANIHSKIGGLIGAAAVTAFGITTGAMADVVTDWNEIMLQSVKTGAMPPPKASRAYAMVQAAVYDSVNSISRTHQPYKFMEATNALASKEAAAATAAHKVLVGLFPSQQAALDQKLADTMASLGGSVQSKLDGQALGMSVGQKMLDSRANDHSNDVVTYTPKDGAGFWKPTPPGNLPALLPNWPAVTPFSMSYGTQFRGTATPPALNSPEYTAAFNQVKELGKSNSATRTADQTNIALFWADGGGTVTPPGHWNRIASTVAIQQNNSVEDNARMFALINLAMADAAIACWDLKYASEFWRPVTGIQLADNDGNSDTDADINWLPLITTPNFPSFTSGHSTFSAAAATVLGQFFGTDSIPFTSTSEGVANTRSFGSFSQAAGEAADSRLYGGIHWGFDNLEGLNCGTALGSWTYLSYLQPAPTPGVLGVLGMGLAAGMRRRR